MKVSSNRSNTKGSTVDKVGGDSFARSREFWVQILSVPCDYDLLKVMGDDLSHGDYWGGQGLMAGEEGVGHGGLQGQEKAAGPAGLSRLPKLGE